MSQSNHDRIIPQPRKVEKVSSRDLGARRWLQSTLDWSKDGQKGRCILSWLLLPLSGYTGHRSHCLGGGYALPASSAHVEYLWRLYEELGHQGHDVAIIMLAYTTAPLATYPTQLNEAADLLQYLLEEEERHPSDVRGRHQPSYCCCCSI